MLVYLLFRHMSHQYCQYYLMNVTVRLVSHHFFKISSAQCGASGIQSFGRANGAAWPLGRWPVLGRFRAVQRPRDPHLNASCQTWSCWTVWSWMGIQCSFDGLLWCCMGYMIQLISIDVNLWFHEDGIVGLASWRFLEMSWSLGAPFLFRRPCQILHFPLQRSLYGALSPWSLLVTAPLHSFLNWFTVTMVPKIGILIVVSCLNFKCVAIWLMAMNRKLDSLTCGKNCTKTASTVTIKWYSSFNDGCPCFRTEELLLFCAAVALMAAALAIWGHWQQAGLAQFHRFHGAEPDGKGTFEAANVCRF